MKLAFSTNAFKRYSLDSAIKQIAEVGYDGVEILCDVPHAYPPDFGEEKAITVSQIISDSGLQISNLNTFTLYARGDVYHPSWIESDEVLREIRTKHTIDCLHLARRLGAKCISTEPGGPLPTSPSRQELYKQFASEVSRVAKVAEKEGVKLLIEPEPSLLLETSSHFRDFIKAIKSDFVKLNFDIGHFYCVGEDPAKSIYGLSDYIEHFHLADIASNRIHNHLVPGRGAIDIGDVLDAIDGIGYDGFVTVELYPYQDTPLEVAREALDYLKGIRSSGRK